MDLLTPALKWNNRRAARWADSSFWGGEGEAGGGAKRHPSKLDTREVFAD
jgi:hypothetical protein